MKFKHFKSGTDIRGTASEGVFGESVDLTDEVIEGIISGFCVWLKESVGENTKHQYKVAVGHDSRVSANDIQNIVTRTLLKNGVNVINCGLSSTPAMFMAVLDLDCDASIQITASHHPFNKNGLKFFTATGGLEGEDIAAILTHAEHGKKIHAVSKAQLESVNYMETYSKTLRLMIREAVQAENYEKPLSGYHIIVDAGNGVGGFYATQVLEPLGAKITGSQFLEPDGMFPNHVPNPENEEAMASIQNAVLKHKADLGIIFDTDVDRAGCVDSKGREINRNRLVALASAIALENNPGGTIVTDSVTSSGLKGFIENDLKGKHHRFKRGYKNVINEAIRLNEEGINAPLAIETSGHAALRENYFLDDGAYLITKIIIKMAQLGTENKTLNDLISTLKEPVESAEIRMRIHDEDFKSVGENIIEKLSAHAQNIPDWHLSPDNYEGVRVSFNEEDINGWFLLRLSVHDPIMPLNIESDTVGGTKKIAEQLLNVLEVETALNKVPLKDYIQA